MRPFSSTFPPSAWIFAALLYLPSARADFERSYAEVKPILNKHCTECHGGRKRRAGLDFYSYRSVKDVVVDLHKWFSVIDQIETGVMPPDDHPTRPTAAEITRLSAWIRKTIGEFDFESVKDPGRTWLRRLNKAEYNNTIRDLTGVDLQPATFFSSDGGGGEGFDNNAEGMTMPPLMVEKYFQAARDISRHAEVTYVGGIAFRPDLSTTFNPRAYLVCAERKVTNFYNDFYDRLPPYNPRTQFLPYLMPAMKLALKDPKAGHREIYDLAMQRKLMPGVFYRWFLAFANAEQDIKASRWNNHYGRWVLDPWLKLMARRERVTDEELRTFHDDFAAKVELAVPATRYTNLPGLDVKTAIRDDARELYLSVGDMDDGNEFDRVVLHDPKITLKDGKTVHLGDLDLLAKQGDSAIHRDQFPDGRAFQSSATKEIKRGFYIEAPALLVFRLPAGAKSFSTTLGMEKSATDKGSVQVYAKDGPIPFPKGKHTHAHFYRGPGHYAVEEAKKWWGIYSSLVGYGKGAGAQEMIDVALSDADRARREAAQREVEFARRQPIADFFAFATKMNFGHLIRTEKDTLPRLDDLPAADRVAPQELSDSARKEWSDLREKAEAFTLNMHGRVKEALLEFAGRAFRGPVSVEDAGKITATYENAMASTDDFQRAAQLTIQSLLTHPRFLFRMESEAPGTEARPVDGHALANRLSYFLWSSMPDKTLMQLAEQGRLREHAILEEQVLRMLNDPKSVSLAEEFAAQWLGFRRILSDKQPDANRFPTYTPELRDTLYREAVLTFDDLVKNDRSVMDIIASKTAFLNEPLAAHYGISGIAGEEMRRVELTTDRRGGFPTMGGVLVATSYPGRTSPVIRGQWVLEALIGGKVPPPPGGVEINESKLSNQTITKRQRFADHSTDPACSVCHERLDPFGFALENYDAIGRFRTREGDQPVDATAQIKGGPRLEGWPGLKRYLMSEKRDAFLHQIARKLLGFALGRTLEYYDEQVVRSAVAELKANDHRFSALAMTIAKSYPFQYRRESDHLARAE